MTPAHLGKMFKAAVAQWEPEPSCNANGSNGCFCQKIPIHTHITRVEEVERQADSKY